MGSHLKGESGRQEITRKLVIEQSTTKLRYRIPIVRLLELY